MDKRRANRYSFRMKAQVDSMGTGELPDPIETWTRDVSSKGLFLELEQPLEEGTRMNVTLQLPSDVTGKPVLLRCLSRVVRVIDEGERRVGVGAVIENYKFVQTRRKAYPPSRLPPLPARGSRPSAPRTPHRTRRSDLT